jgi:Ca2+-binding EF-hand superfamily protein
MSQALSKDPSNYYTDKEEKELKVAFSLIDLDGDGLISHDDLETALSAAKFAHDGVR